MPLQVIKNGDARQHNLNSRHVKIPQEGGFTTPKQVMVSIGLSPVIRSANNLI